MKEGKLLCLTFLINFLTNTNFYFDTSSGKTSGKLIFGNEKPLEYSPVFIITEFDINKFEKQFLAL